MPAMEVSDLRQDAVYWAKSGVDDLGNVKVLAGVALKVRWETKNVELTDSRGNVIGIDSTVVVDQVVTVGSIMWLGKLADVPVPPTDLREIVDYSEIPDVKNRNSRRVVKLVKYSDTLPDLA